MPIYNLGVQSLGPPNFLVQHSLGFCILGSQTFGGLEALATNFAWSSNHWDSTLWVGFTLGSTRSTLWGSKGLGYRFLILSCTP